MECFKNMIEHTHFKKKKVEKNKKSLFLEKLEHFYKSYFWQLPRTFAEPRRFVIVFDRQIAAPNAVFDLNGTRQRQSFGSSPIRLDLQNYLLLCGAEVFLL